MSIRIVHTADLHLGSEYKSFHNKAGDLYAESLGAFEKLINYTIDQNNEIDILIIAGDLFDNHKPEIALTEKVKDLLLKVVKNNVKLFILPGNHDSYSYKNSIFRTNKFPGKVISNQDFSLVNQYDIRGEQLYIYGGIFELSNPDKKILENFRIVQQPGTHVGILHGTLDMKDEMVSDTGLPFSFDEFKRTGLNYLALGHFHKYKELEKDNAHKLAYPGSLVPRTIDEYGNKYTLLVEIEPNNFVRTEKLQFSKVKVEKVILNVIKENVNDLSELVNVLKKYIDPDLIMDLYLEGVMEVPIQIEDLETLLQEYFYYTRITNNIKYIDASLIKRVRDEETIRGVFFRKMFEKAQILGDKKQSVVNQAISLGLRDFTQAGQQVDLKESREVLEEEKDRGASDQMVEEDGDGS